MPPNQAVTVQVQRKIHARRAQTPPRRHVAAIIRKKTKQLLRDCGKVERAALATAARSATLLTARANTTAEIRSGSVSLVVTSPPFLDVVNYAGDNWLRCWFIGVDAAAVALTVPKKVEAWQSVMTDVFVELCRVLRPGGHVAFEVGEVRGGTIKIGRSRDSVRSQGRFGTIVGVDQRPEIHQDRQLLGRGQQRQRHKHQPRGGLPQALSVTMQLDFNHSSFRLTQFCSASGGSSRKPIGRLAPKRPAPRRGGTRPE